MIYVLYFHLYRGAGKSLARSGRKQAPATKLYRKPTPPKKNQKVYRPIGSNYLRVGRKMATFQLFFSVGSG